MLQISLYVEESFYSVCSALTLAQLSYKVIVDKDIQSLSLANKARTIIMMDIGMISETEAEVIRQFVKDGGTLFASAETSLYDENRIRRGDFALADLFGCSYSGPITDEGKLVIKEKYVALGNMTGEIDLPDEFCAVKTNDSVKTLGSIRLADGSKHPGLLLNNYGKGTVFYFAGHPERSLAISGKGWSSFGRGKLPPILPGQVWTDRRDPLMVRLFCNILKTWVNA